MGPITYTALLVIIFIVTVFIFGYFEEPVIALKKGLLSLNKRARKLKNIRFLILTKKNEKSLTIGLSKTKLLNKTNNSDDVRVYMHEY